MKISDRHIENPLFFKWIYQPTPELEDYWQNYMKLYPAEANEIRYLQKQFGNLKISNDALSELEKKALARSILKKLERKDHQKHRRRLLAVWGRYAAIVLLCLLVGGGIVFWEFNQKYDELLSLNLGTPVNTTEPVLILDETNHIRLGTKEVSLDYSQEDLIILNESEKLESTSLVGSNQLIVPYGTRAKVRLSDGTLVWLNAGSRLIYPAVFDGGSRNVTLVGEAFFDVEKDRDHPFIVKTSDVRIKVLGTRFNVAAYPDEELIQTTLEEGAIALKSKTSGWFDRDLVLKPNQRAVIDKTTGNLNVSTVVASNSRFWVQGILSFQNAELRNVVSRLERFYNIRFSYAETVNKNMKITGKLDLHQQRDEVFKYLEQVTGATFIAIDEFNYKLN